MNLIHALQDNTDPNSLVSRFRRHERESPDSEDLADLVRALRLPSANLKLIDELGLVQNAGDTGAYFRKALTDALAGHRNVGEVRGDGLMAAVELAMKRAESRTSTATGAPSDVKRK